MFCMSTYAERLSQAMKVRGMDPLTNQSHLARLVGEGCKPQNIQHLLDPNKNAKWSKYTSRLATVLKVDPEWLAYDKGRPPVAEVMGLKDQAAESLGDLESTQRAEAMRLVDSLSGSKLTHALALLQDLARATESDGRIEGGEAEVQDSPAKIGQAR